MEEDQSKVKFTIKDLEDGSYEVRYKVDEECETLIDVKYLDENGQLQPVRGNPFKGSFSAAVKGEANNNSLVGAATGNFVRTSLKNIREFLKETNEEIDYKEKNLDNVTDVITIMNALGQIERC